MLLLRRIRFGLISLFAAVICSSSFAATRVWINPAGGSWSVASNWDTGVPLAGDDVVISGSTVYTVTLDVAATINSLTLGDAVPDAIQSLTMPGSTLTINGPSVVHGDGRLNWNAGTLGGTGTVDISSGAQLVIGGAISAKSLAGLDINNAGTVQWLATTINCTGGAVFQNFGGASFLAGGFNLNGETCEFRNAGSFVKSGTGSMTVSVTFKNDGVVDVTAGTLALTEAGTHSGSFTTIVGATLQFGGGSNLQTLNASSSVSGSGTLRFATGTTNIAGTVNITNFTDFAGNANLTGTITSLGDSVLISNGVANLNAGGTVVIPNALTLTAGTLTGTTSVAVNGPTTWNGGTLQGTGQLTVNGGMTIGGTANKTWNQKVVDNPATATWNSTNITAGQGARFNNLATGLLDMRGNVVLQLVSPDVALFDNQGTLRRSVGTGTAVIDVPFQGPGPVEVLTGTLEFRESSTHDGNLTVASGATLYLGTGTHSINAGTSLSGAGTLRVQGTVNVPGTINLTGRTWLTAGTLNVTGTLSSLGNSVEMDAGTLNLAVGGTLTVPGALILDGGTLTGTTSVIVNGLTTWNAATLSITGKLTVNGGMTIGSASGKTWIRTEIDNPGVTNYYGWHLNSGQGARFNNLPTGTFNMRGDASIILNQGGTALFNNEGTVRRLDSAGTASIDVPFSSTGLVEVQTGTLSFRDNGTFNGDLTYAAGSTLMFESGTHTIDAASSISGAGTLRIHITTVNMAGTLNSTGRTWLSAGTFNVTGPVTSLGNPFQMDGATANLAVGGTLTVPTLILNAGTLTGNTSLVVTGLTTWNSTTLQLDGKLTPSGGMTISSAGSRIWIKTIIDNPATTTWTGWNMNMGQGARFNNLPTGTFDIRTDASMFLNQGGTATFNNEGTVLRSAGAGQALFAVPFESTGSVDVQTGTLLFNAAPAAFDGDVTIGAGTTLMFSSGTSYAMNAGSTLTGAGTLRVHFTSTLGIAGTVDMTGRTWVSGGTLNITGTLVSLGEDVQIDGSSLVNLAAGGTLTIPDSLTLEGGTLTGPTSIIVNGPTTWNNATLALTGKLTVNGGLNLHSNVKTWIRTEIDNPATTTWTSVPLIPGVGISAGQGARFNNLPGGTFIVATDADLVFNQGGAAPQFHNAGSFRKTAGTATATGFAAQFTNTGTVEATAGTLSFTNGFTQTSGTTRLNGGILGSTLAPGLDIQGGILTGAGTINGNVRNAGALNAGQSPGRIHITGTYTQTDSGIFNAELSGLTAGTEHDQVTIAGAATLGGTLNAINIEPYEPSDGDAFTVMTYASATGDFATKNVTFGPGRSFSTSKNATNYVLLAAVIEADVSIVKSGPSSIPAAQPIPYNLTVSNAGPKPAEGIVVTDTLDPSVTFAGANTAGFWMCGASGQVVTCTATGTLAVGATAEPIVISATAPAGGTVSNSASVTATTHDQNPANNSAGPVTTSITPVADLTITKSDSPDPVEANAALQYTITVANNGPSVAEPVTVIDTLPSGVGFVSAGGSGWSCGFNDPVVTCTTASLGVGTAPQIVIEVTAPAQGGTITNSATVSSPADQTDSSAVATTTVLAADLAINKSAPASVNAAESFAYTITVENLGPSDAAGVTVTDPLDANVTFVSANTAGFWNCAHSAGTVTCTSTANLPVGTAPESITINVTAPNEPMSVSNSATVSGSISDPNAANDTSGPITTTVVASADLAIAKTASPEPVGPNQTLTFSLIVQNTGPSTSSAVTVQDSLDSRFTFGSATGDGWSCGFAAGTVTCTRASLAAGFSPVIDIVVQTPYEPATIGNTASVAAETADPDAANNSATIQATITAAIDLSVTKSDSPDPVIVGTSLTYTITVANAGPSTATSVVMNDPLPAEVTFFSVSSTQGSCSEAGGTVSCQLGSMPLDATAIVTIVVTPHSVGVISNTATVSASETDSNPDNNSATQATTVGQLNADLSITKLDTPDPVAVGAPLTYTIQVSNAGPDAAASVAVTDVLPAGVTLVSAGGNGWNCTGSLTVTCTLPSLGVGPAEPITLLVNTSIDGTIINTASVTSTTNDPDPANNAAEQQTTVLPATETCQQAAGAGMLANNRLAGFAFAARKEPGAPPAGAVGYADRRVHLIFYSTAIDSLTVTGSSATIQGQGKANGSDVSFRVDVTDSQPDTFRIELSNGYTASGNALGVIVLEEVCANP